MLRNDQPLSFQDGYFVYPLLAQTSSSDGPALDEVRTTIRLESTKVPSELTINDAQAGARYGTWHIQENSTASITVDIEFPVTCYNTVFDEVAASAVEWPKGNFPAECESVFDSTMYLDYVSGDHEVGRLDKALLGTNLDKWLDGNRPWDYKPVPFAKLLATRVFESVQISSNGVKYRVRRRRETDVIVGNIIGFNTQSPSETLENMRGSPLDIAILLTDLYREAGLPARMVIGLDTQRDPTKPDENDHLDRLRVWVEFALWDESTKTLTWVPVDIPEMRSSSSRKNNRTNVLPYFGTHNELNHIVPISHHLHPPEPIVSRTYGAPALYGLRFSPEASTQWNHTIKFTSRELPIRSSNKHP